MKIYFRSVAAYLFGLALVLALLPISASATTISNATVEHLHINRVDAVDVVFVKMSSRGGAGYIGCHSNQNWDFAFPLSDSSSPNDPDPTEQALYSLLLAARVSGTPIATMKGKGTPCDVFSQVETLRWVIF